MLATSGRDASAIFGIPQVVGADAAERFGIALAVSVAFDHVSVDCGQSWTRLRAVLAVVARVAHTLAVVTFAVSATTQSMAVHFDLTRTDHRAIIARVTAGTVAVVPVHVFIRHAFTVSAALDHLVPIDNRAWTRLSAVLAVVTRIAGTLRRVVVRASSVPTADYDIVLLITI